MKKVKAALLTGVDNLELFYDLIFVFSISVLTSLLHHPAGGMIDLRVYGTYLVSFLIVLQVWMYTTLLMNRYGTKSLSDYACLFTNMFLLYFMCQGITTEWREGAFQFNLSWALILLNLFVHWGLKLVHFDGLDDDDAAIIWCAMRILGAQFVLVVTSMVLHGGMGGWMSVIALVAGYVLFFQGKVFRLKPARFSHITERCCLLVIVDFGETVMALAAFTGSDLPMLMSVLVFVLVAGLFLVYDYEYDNLLDHHARDDGMRYLVLHALIVLIIDHVTLGLEFLVNDGFDRRFASGFLAAAVVCYLVSSFALSRYNLPQYRMSKRYVLGRIIGAATIVAATACLWERPMLNLLVDDCVVAAVLGYEIFLFHGRNAMVEAIHEAGDTVEDLLEAGYSFETMDARGQIVRDVIADGEVDDARAYIRERRRDSSTDVG